MGVAVDTGDIKIVLIFDFFASNRNHKKYGNILYSDGHLEGFRGGNWKDNIINPPSVKKENSD
ncbi:MAG: hypothetical protein WCS96_00035 [Victivallales bacterium]|jgi:prepilin-type processing-associated H-X9-DG protein